MLALLPGRPWVQGPGCSVRPTDQKAEQQGEALSPLADRSSPNSSGRWENQVLQCELQPLLPDSQSPLGQDPGCPQAWGDQSKVSASSASSPGCPCTRGPKPWT